ncbi:MAG: leucine-rich repeat domain-containing protein, partial [Kiritimatiellae bacterium]|nr:leucine-rich repeat domain-containing protein [Kiritimatiellia bacterium]
MKQKVMMLVAVLAAAFAVRGEDVWSCDSEPVRIDTGNTHTVRDGATILADPAWHGAESFTVSLDGEELFTATEAAGYEWRPSVTGTFTLTGVGGTHTETAVFHVLSLTAESGDCRWTYTVENGGVVIGDGSGVAVSPAPEGRLEIPATLGGFPVAGIAASAFNGCGELTEVLIPNTVTNIGANAFSGCSGLTSVTIPDSVMNIGSSAFSDCGALTNMVLPFVGARRGNSGTTDSLFGYIFGTSSYTGGMVKQYYTSGSYSTFYIPSSLRNVTITDETALGYGAFYGCSGLTNVTIGNSVTSIGNYAFYNCSGLTSVTIPDSVTNIGSSSFYGCSGLTSVTIGNGLTSIESSAFYNCSGLTSVTIPDSVTNIGDRAFYDCYRLTSVTIPQCLCNDPYPWSSDDGMF